MTDADTEYLLRNAHGIVLARASTAGALAVKLASNPVVEHNRLTWHGLEMVRRTTRVEVETRTRWRALVVGYVTGREIPLADPEYWEPCGVLAFDYTDAGSTSAGSWETPGEATAAHARALRHLAGNGVDLKRYLSVRVAPFQDKTRAERVEEEVL